MRSGIGHSGAVAVLTYSEVPDALRAAGYNSRLAVQIHNPPHLAFAVPFTLSISLKALR